MTKKVLVGLSGGVDSAVSAHILQKKGYQVHGVFMENWQDQDSHCTTADDRDQAQLVAEHLGIGLDIVNFSDEYYKTVFDTMLKLLEKGYTPNPDILCNQEIKFQHLMDYARKKDAFLATGHYAQIIQDLDTTYLGQGLDKNKDQSYFLCRIPKDSLAKILFPLGGMHKTEVRLLAEKLKLPNAKRKDSTGICFIGKRRFDDFISGYLLNKPGVIQTLEGKEIGKHDGLFYYTIGQRKGLKIGGGKHFDETPWYVIDKDMTTRTLIVAQGQNHPALFKKTLQVDDMHWLKNAPGNYFKAHAKIRHRQNDQTCYVTVLNNDKSKIEIVFEEKQRAITPGQYAVLYQNEICLGGGAICETSG